MSMTDFAKTRAGSRFFQSDIPRLIDALEKIATALEEGNKVGEHINSQATYDIPRNKYDANNIEEYIENDEDDVQKPSTETG